MGKFPYPIAALALDVHLKKVPQAMTPALEKVARLYRVDPTATLESIIEIARALEPMTEAELEARRLMQRNQIDRKIVHPRSVS